MIDRKLLRRIPVEQDAGDHSAYAYDLGLSERPDHQRIGAQAFDEETLERI